MLRTIAFRLKAFRISYLSVSLLATMYSVYLLVDGIITGLEEGIAFRGIVGLIALAAVALFQTGIVSFIIRSLRTGQTLLMKHLVFKNDGRPYYFGLILAAVSSAVTLVLAVLLFVALLFPHMDGNMRLLVADIMLTFGLNLAFTVVFYFTFKHESGTFELI